ncbi:alpha/beta fold hydrolase [Sphingomonas bacterium]|uniref:alpha/beta fold hydrolase n=1 Tax=Sphingomonas bacterium TaxID=1895847 RepID=UPI001576ECC4|nr:alpha/beta fold hydrolase [Sphingomonas bacterium]
MAQTGRITFILVPGAMHTAWAWHRVVPLIEAQGNVAVTPDLPGIGTNHSVRPEDATLDMWGGYVADIVRSADAPVILVGHSRGGLVIGEVAERVPELVAGLIYVCALIVPPGRTALDVMGTDQTKDDGPRPSEDGKTISISAEAAIPLFYNRCLPEDAADAVAHLRPEPAVPNATPATVTRDRWYRVPRAYIETSTDNNLTLAKQRQIQSAAPCDPVVIIDADHSPFLSAAPALVDALVDAAADMMGNE